MEQGGESCKGHRVIIIFGGVPCKGFGTAFFLHGREEEEAFFADNCKISKGSASVLFVGSHNSNDYLEDFKISEGCSGHGAIVFIHTDKGLATLQFVPDDTEECRMEHPCEACKALSAVIIACKMLILLPLMFLMFLICLDCSDHCN